MNNIYDAEFHPLIHSPTNQTPCRRWVNFFLYLTLVLCIIAFSVTDLTYGYSYTPCITVHDDPMPINLTTWLQFSGWFGCLIIVIAISCCCSSIPRNAQLIISMIPQIMMFSWLLIGNVIYWKNYYNNNNCEQGLITYLMVRFYVGFVLVIASAYHEFKLT